MTGLPLRTSGLAWEFPALFVGNLIGIVATGGAGGIIMGGSRTLSIGFLPILLGFGYFVLPIVVSILVLHHLGRFSFREQPWRSASSLALCIVMPFVTYAALYFVGMNGCWHSWLAGVACDW
jgi:hypothetical protein